MCGTPWAHENNGEEAAPTQNTQIHELVETVLHPAKPSTLSVATMFGDRQCRKLCHHSLTVVGCLTAGGLASVVKFKHTFHGACNHTTPKSQPTVERRFMQKCHGCHSTNGHITHVEGAAERGNLSKRALGQRNAEASVHFSLQNGTACSGKPLSIMFFKSVVFSS